MLGKLGYQRSDMVAATPIEDIAALREEYELALGKKPFMGWDVATLRAKIAEAKDGK